MLSRMLLIIRSQLLLVLMRLRAWVPSFMGFGVREVEGQPVNPTLRWFLRLVLAEPKKSTPANKRGIYDLISDSYLGGPVVNAEVADLSPDGRLPVPVRIYRPPGQSGPLPCVMWIHGGGYVFGGLRSHDRFCRKLCREADVVVVALDYRLAPEHPFPAAHEDVAGTYQWVRANANELKVDLDRFAVAGDSAGGGLTAVLCQSLAVAERPRLQVLCYPGTDLSKAWPSYEAWADGYFLNRTLMRWCLNQYCPVERREEPRASPLLAESLRGQPPALLITAGMDPLQDEGHAYGDKLERDGVQVRRIHVAPMVHGFITLTGVLPLAERSVCEIAQQINEQLNA